MSVFRSSLLVLAIAMAAPAFANAEPESCRRTVSDAPVPYGEASNQSQLTCDIDRAIDIARRAEQIHGPRKAALITIVDTASPSGTAYLYDLVDGTDGLVLEARSVPAARAGSRTPVCRLTTALPPAVTEKVFATLGSGDLQALPAYGSREKVTFNPDGSRTVRLLLDPHDVVTTILTPDGPHHFSRHAESSDRITVLNNLVIEVANFSSDWSCNRP